MGLPKAALLRAVSDEIPVAMLESIGSTYIPPEEIYAAAREAVTGGEDGSASFAGINRYLFFSGGESAFVDPAGILTHDTQEFVRELRRARGADPQGLKARNVRPATRQQAHPPQPNGGA